jgi:predicted TIM-barrel fold metal-dependent hydrolase
MDEGEGMKVDAFNHLFPKQYYDRMLTLGSDWTDINKRVRAIPSIVDLDARFKIMDEFGPDYRQIVCLAAPAIEDFGPRAAEMARLANDCFAELCVKYPDRFFGFAAALPMNDTEAMLREAERAVAGLGACGVQVYTNVSGKPLTAPETLPLFDLMAKLDMPIWMHPIRGANFADYLSENKSDWEIWWTFGWPYETSAAMAHIVFSGIFDRHPSLKIIVHHLGAMVPYFAGRVGPGWDQLGSRTSDEDYSVLLKQLKKRPIDYFRMFYADTALFGARDATVCGVKFYGTDKVLFSSDMPFDPEKGTAYIRWTIEIIDGLEITPVERLAIYEGNARKLLKI